MKVPGILKNKYVLYVLLVIGIVNILGYISLQDYNSLALFVVLGLLSSYFSKNMAVNLLIAIVVTSFVSINNVREGFTEGHEKEDVKSKTDKAKEAAKAALKAAEEATKGSADHTHHKHAIVKEDGLDNDEEEDDDEDKKCDPECIEGKECVQGTCVTKEKYQNNVPPSSPALLKEETDESIGKRIDYAATMEQAYDNLQNMLGKDGMKSITAETKKLVSQQKDLMGTLNSMAPMLNSAKETLEGLNLNDMEGMSDILKKLQGGAPPKISMKKKK
jgi:hypothetical protein